MWYDGLGLPNFGGAGVSFPSWPGDWFSSELDGDESAKGLLGAVGPSARLAADPARERTPHGEFRAMRGRLPALLADIADQFDVVQTMADGQREFLHGVIEFYQTLTSTHKILAAETTATTAVQQNDDMRKITAWVAIVAVPTAVTGYFGQNVP
jgi:Mg2+ and Co2+ transporter CorA